MTDDPKPDVAVGGIAEVAAGAVTEVPAGDVAEVAAERPPPFRRTRWRA